MRERFFEKEVEAHWQFVEQFILKLSKWKDAPKFDDTLLEFMKFLYTEAMIHGFKHGSQVLGENKQ